MACERPCIYLQGVGVGMLVVKKGVAVVVVEKSNVAVVAVKKGVAMVVVKKGVAMVVVEESDVAMVVVEESDVAVVVVNVVTDMFVGSAFIGVKTHGFSKIRRSSIAAWPSYDVPREMNQKNWTKENLRKTNF
jgi:hypothetical protein